MIGNDVVDLSDRDCADGARHPRFDARAFAPGERRRLAADPEPRILRWVLWAAKEAAYKALRRHDPGLHFHPRDFVVHLDARREGRVNHPRGTCAVRVEVDGDCVHAVACADGAPSAVTRVAARHEGPEADAGRAVRALVLSDLPPRLGTTRHEVCVARDGRVPRLVTPRGDAALSLAHHGRFVAYAACAPARENRP